MTKAALQFLGGFFVGVTLAAFMATFVYLAYRLVLLLAQMVVVDTTFRAWATAVLVVGLAVGVLAIKLKEAK